MIYETLLLLLAAALLLFSLLKIDGGASPYVNKTNRVATYSIVIAIGVVLLTCLSLLGGGAV